MCLVLALMQRTRVNYITTDSEGRVELGIHLWCFFYVSTQQIWKDDSQNCLPVWFELGLAIQKFVMLGKVK